MSEKLNSREQVNRIIKIGIIASATFLAGCGNEKENKNFETP